MHRKNSDKRVNNWKNTPLYKQSFEVVVNSGYSVLFQVVGILAASL